MFSYLQVLAQWWRFLVFNTLIVIALMAVVLYVFVPNEFKATASIIPPAQEGGLGGTISQLAKGMLPTELLGDIGVSSATFNYLAILESRTAMEEVIERHDMLHVLAEKSGLMSVAVAKLREKTEFEIGENNNIFVSVIDTDKDRAAAMANTFVDVLNEISVDLNTQSARNNREFIEKRYKRSMTDLRTLEDSLQMFQEKYGVLSLPDQTKAAIDVAAELQAKLTVAQVELGVLERTLGENNPEVSLQKAEIAEIRSKLRQMRSGDVSEGFGNVDEMFIPFSEIPEIGMEYLRLYREFEIQSKILEFIVPLYEQAKVEENKTIPVVLVLDRAVPPYKKHWPPRMLILAALMFVSVSFLSLMIFFLLWVAKHSSGTSIEQRLVRLKDSLARRYKVRSPAAPTPDTSD